MPPSLRVRGPSSKTGQTVLATNVSKLLCIHFHARGGGGTKAYEHCQSTRVHEVIWPYSARASFDLFRPGGWRIQPPSPP